MSDRRNRTTPNADANASPSDTNGRPYEAGADGISPALAADGSRREAAVLLRTNYAARNRSYRDSCSNNLLDEEGASEDFEHSAGPRRVLQRLQSVKEEKPSSRRPPQRVQSVRRRKSSRKLSNAVTRSLEDLRDLGVSEAVLPDEGVVRWKSLPGLASASDEEGLERDPLADEHFPRHDFLVNAESMEEQAASVVTEQSVEGVHGSIELETGVENSTYPTCWRGVVTKKLGLRFYVTTRHMCSFIRLTPETMCISEEVMKTKVNTLSLHQHTFERPCTSTPQNHLQ